MRTNKKMVEVDPLHLTQPFAFWATDRVAEEDENGLVLHFPFFLFLNRVVLVCWGYLCIWSMDPFDLYIVVFVFCFSGLPCSLLAVEVNPLVYGMVCWCL